MDKIPLEKSISSLLRLSVQNMLTLVSVNLMLFVDRIILAKHSVASLNASVTAGTVGNIFIYGAIAIVGIGDVLIGQSYGAGDTKRIGRILWQMVWFCLMIAMAFILIAAFFTPYLFSDSEWSESATYFKWQMGFGFLPVMVAALTSFFVGTKRFGFALMAVLIANITKLVLELPLVFGIDGLFVGFGVRGAIAATAISQAIHIAVLASVMMRKENRFRFDSLNYRFQPMLFVECLRLGLPQSIGIMLHYAAWGIVVGLLAATGQKHLMMYTIIDSTYNLFGFATEGLQKSVLSISANLIGSGRSGHMHELFAKALRILIPILMLLTVPLLWFPTMVTQGLGVDVLSQQEVSLACLVIWIYFGFDGLSWILNGLLTAMGDTIFVNPITGISSFVSMAATYVMTAISHCEPELTCWISVIYGVLCSVLLFLRFRNKSRCSPSLKTEEYQSMWLVPRALKRLSSIYGPAHSNNRA